MNRWCISELFLMPLWLMQGSGWTLPLRLLWLLLWFNASLFREATQGSEESGRSEAWQFLKVLCDFYKLCTSPDPYQSMIQMELYISWSPAFLQSSGFAETPPSGRGKVHICLHGSYRHCQTVHFGVWTTQVIFNTFPFYFAANMYFLLFQNLGSGMCLFFKTKFLILSQIKAMPKNVQIIVQRCSFHMLER